MLAGLSNWNYFPQPPLCLPGIWACFFPVWNGDVTTALLQATSVFWGFGWVGFLGQVVIWCPGHAAQGSGGVPRREGFKSLEMWSSGTWVIGGLGSVGLVVGLDLKGLFQPSLILLFIEAYFLMRCWRYRTRFEIVVCAEKCLLREYWMYGKGSMLFLRPLGDLSGQFFSVQAWGINHKSNIPLLVGGGK